MCQGDSIIRGCVSNVVISFHSISCFIYMYLVSITNVQYMEYGNNWVHISLKMVFVCLYITPSLYHHDADLSEGIGYIEYYRIWYILSIICLRFHSRHYVLCNIQGYVFSAEPPRFLYLWKLSHYHHQSKIQLISHCLWLGRETMVCAGSRAVSLDHRRLLIMYISR